MEVYGTPYCPKCGSPVSEDDRFCSLCGQPLNTQLSTQTSYAYRNFPLKPTTNLMNGFFIGAGATMIIVGLFISFALNAIYWQQSNLVSSQGLDISIYVFSSGLILLISIGVFMSIMGAYLLVLGCINQFNVVARIAMGRKDGRARIGNGLISGGFVLTILSISNLIEAQYRPYSSGWFGFVTLLLVIGGLVMIFAGALLIRNSYLRSLSPTKV